MFCNQLKIFRTNLGLTQNDVARKLSISRQCYCGYELGRREPSIENIKKLCIVFNCTTDELLEMDNPKLRNKIIINE